jgi:hypothetical protein
MSATTTNTSAALSPDALDVVERYLDALVAHDHDAVAGLIAPTGFRYESPIATFDDTPAFLEYIMMTGGILHGITRRHVFVDAGHVCHWLVLDTQVSERVSTRAAQWAHVRDGQIVHIELLFDPHRWRLLFQTDD